MSVVINSPQKHLLVIKKYHKAGLFDLNHLIQSFDLNHDLNHSKIMCFYFVY